MKETTFIILIAAILIAVIIILYEIEKIFRKKLEIQRKDRNLYYKRQTRKISKSKENPKKILSYLNHLEKNFFKEAFDLSERLTYSDLIEEFRGIGKKECQEFCELMIEANYAKEKLTKKEIKNLIGLFKRIIEKEKIKNWKEIKKAKIS